MNRHSVIVEFSQQDLSAALKQQPTAHRLQRCDPLKHRSPHNAVKDLVHLVRNEIRGSNPFQFRSIEGRSRVRLRQLQRPFSDAFVFIGPMPERYPAGPQTEVRGVEVGREESLFRQSDRSLDEISQVGKGELAIGRQLHFSLGGIVGHPANVPTRAPCNQVRDFSGPRWRARGRPGRPSGQRSARAFDEPTMGRNSSRSGSISPLTGSLLASSAFLHW